MEHGGRGLFFWFRAKKNKKNNKTSEVRGAHYNVEGEEERNKAKEDEEKMIQG